MPSSTSAPVAILLAAGDSSRLPPDKLLVDVGGMTMLERTLRSLRSSPRVSDVILVLPSGGKASYGWLKGVDVHLIENPDTSKGMIASIRVGLSSGWAQERPFLLMPADVPFVPPSVITRVIVDLLTRDAQIVVPAYRGLGGHPTAFQAALADDFFRHGDRDGAREVLARHRDTTLRLNLPEPDICFDIDTPADLSIALDPQARWARVEAQVEERQRLRRG